MLITFDEEESSLIQEFISISIGILEKHGENSDSEKELLIQFENSNKVILTSDNIEYIQDLVAYEIHIIYDFSEEDMQDVDRRQYVKLVNSILTKLNYPFDEEYISKLASNNISI